MNKIFNSKTAKIGFLVIAVTALLLAVLIAVNLIFGALPKNLSILDLTAKSIYSVSDTTKRDVARVNEKINVYLLAAGDEASLDDTGIHLDTFLKRVCAINGNISYSIVNLYTDTTFLSDRSIDASAVTLNSVVVESAKRHRYIDSGDIFYYHIEEIGKVNQNEAQLYQMYYGLTPTYQFAGEGLFVKSLEYVTSDSLPLIINLTGHGETAISESLKSEFTANNLTYSELSTLSLVPVCDMLLMNYPTSDISAAEADILNKYVDGGGKLMVLTAPDSSKFVNLTSLLGHYGLELEEGIIIEQSTGQYAQYPFFLAPSTSSYVSEYTGSSSLLFPYAHGIKTVSSDTTPILSTGDTAYIVPVTFTNLDKPEGAEEKSFTVGAVSETQNGGSVIWLSSYLFLDESANTQSGGENYKYATALIKQVCGAKTDDDKVVTAPLVLTTEHITISTGALSVISILTVIVIPTIILATGGVYCYKRKRK